MNKYPFHSECSFAILETIPFRLDVQCAYEANNTIFKPHSRNSLFYWIFHNMARFNSNCVKSKRCLTRNEVDSVYTKKVLIPFFICYNYSLFLIKYEDQLCSLKKPRKNSTNSDRVNKQGIFTI